jgi:hypothetical protein
MNMPSTSETIHRLFFEAKYMLETEANRMLTADENKFLLSSVTSCVDGIIAKGARRLDQATIKVESGKITVYGVIP